MASTAPYIKPWCKKCNKAESAMEAPIKFCARCHTTRYCSRACQTADWKVHKTQCSASASGGTSSSSSANASAQDPARPCAIPKPFTALCNQTYLHSRPEEDVYELLIDAFRLRCTDDYTFSGSAPRDSIYGGGSAYDVALRFTAFLLKFAQAGPWVPQWWSPEKQTACVGSAARRYKDGVWGSLGTVVQKSDIRDHYGDHEMPMQLRMLAQEILGERVSGAPGGFEADRSICQVKMQYENGGAGYQSVMDVAGAS